MENQSAFDLNQAIQSWRENLAQSPAFQRENLNELESHLRDSIATLQTRGLSAAEAFLIATKRIGSSHALTEEFAKCNYNNVWLERLLWMVVGIQVWPLMNEVIGSISQDLLILAIGWSGAGGNWHEQGVAMPVILFAFVRGLSVLASAWLVWWLIFRKGNRLGMWLSMRLRRSFIGYCVGASALFIAVNGVIGITPLLLRQQMNMQTYGDAVKYLSYSEIIVQPVLAIAMLVLTLTLIRKRASANSASAFAR